jgi:hypothetical protein
MKIVSHEEYEELYSFFSELLKIKNISEGQIDILNKLSNILIEYEMEIGCVKPISKKMYLDIIEVTKGLEFDLDKPLNIEDE